MVSILINSQITLPQNSFSTVNYTLTSDQLPDWSLLENQNYDLSMSDNDISAALKARSLAMQVQIDAMPDHSALVGQQITSQ
jgi:hypothetical protein